MKIVIPFVVIVRPERLYWVLVLGLQYSCVLGFPNTYNQFCIISNTIQYYTIQQGRWSKEKHIRETEWDKEEEEEHSKNLRENRKCGEDER